jgi:hypothetical protein
MVFNATFNNISVISWRSVLFLEETRVPEGTIELLQVTDKLYPLVVIWTDCIGSYKSNYHTIMITTGPIIVHFGILYKWNLQ